MPAHDDVVPDLHEIINFGAFADHGVLQRAAVDAAVGADLHVVLDDDPADLRHLEVALGAHGEAEPVLADPHAGMQDDPVADQRVHDGGAGADVAAAADGHPVADDGAGGDPSCRARSAPRGRRRRRARPSRPPRAGRSGCTGGSPAPPWRPWRSWRRDRGAAGPARTRGRGRPHQRRPRRRARARQRRARPGRPRRASPPSWLRYLRLSRNVTWPAPASASAFTSWMRSVGIGARRELRADLLRQRHRGGRAPPSRRTRDAPSSHLCEQARGRRRRGRR